MRNSLDVKRLARLLKAKRGAHGLREVSLEIGDVSPSTLSRVENGRMPDMNTFLRLCDWLQIPASALLEVRGAPSSPSDGRVCDGSEGKINQPVPEQVALQLRADENLDETTAQALAEVVRAIYRNQNVGDKDGERSS